MRRVTTCARRWASAQPHTPREDGYTEEGFKAHLKTYDTEQTFTAGSGTDIASEPSIFGVHGWKPLPPASQEHYAESNMAFSSVTITHSKATRGPAEPKKVLPKPAKKVVLFGATGFQGTRIAKKLVENPEYEEVRLCTRYPDQIPADLQKVIDLNPAKVTLEETNVLDKPSVNKAIQGCDAVVSAIDMRNDDFYNLHHHVYVRGISNIAMQCRMEGIKRIVYVSGLDAIFGNESDYSDFRCKAEDMLLAECFFGVVLRPGQLYGRGYTNRQSSFGKQFYPVCYPHTKLQPTWVEDLAEATHRVLQRPDAVKRVIELGGPKVMTHMQYASERAMYHKGPKPFPVNAALADIVAFFNELTCPKPKFSRNLICEMEMDQVALTKAENPHVWTFADLDMEPASMEDAATRERNGEGWFMH
eukprot:TRINITY_DN9099_c0_g3_i1.p1 TRINITY_DN9099_c0_g3~~TRINITY_DN9099_c0_g3_i1.p1  ORF type:complete len:417 (+),score=145.24 TRINITY_DN9099_c0_g3_i1:64-1314(+)